jgi:hypothetical protein|tara:strand:- start:57 stop:374 length:318 start_codon:yes stop_codon:yes gene_type:complete
MFCIRVGGRDRRALFVRGLNVMFSLSSAATLAAIASFECRPAFRSVATLNGFQSAFAAYDGRGADCGRGPHAEVLFARIALPFCPAYDRRVTVFVVPGVVDRAAR